VVVETLEANLGVFDDLGCIVEEGEPDFTGADEAFKVLRAWRFEVALGELLDEHRELMKESVVWNIEQGRNLTGPQIGRAEKARMEVFQRVASFMEEYEFMIMPVAQVAPFDLQNEYVREISGVPMETYIDWMRSCYYISVVGLPAISVPGGFTPDGLPVGLQIVGRHLQDISVLQLAYAFQQGTSFWRRRPKAVTP
jgi:amidase